MKHEGTSVLVSSELILVLTVLGARACSDGVIINLITYESRKFVTTKRPRVPFQGLPTPEKASLGRPALSHVSWNSSRPIEHSSEPRGELATLAVNHGGMNHLDRELTSPANSQLSPGTRPSTSRNARLWMPKRGSKKFFFLCQHTLLNSNKHVDSENITAFGRSTWLSSGDPSDRQCSARITHHPSGLDASLHPTHQCIADDQRKR